MIYSFKDWLNTIGERDPFWSSFYRELLFSNLGRTSKSVSQYYITESKLPWNK